eukprot:TRINITY_DN8034_c1_g1_i1.p2 TRINITY_DN8034_c1_g1~~TRINITY_DN8034_c1_g1_i1.p2  ORF type:complete len:699 (+),score=388.89 TRINITY_DN8034_c1_g1_i1:111-2207(+)
MSFADKILGIDFGTQNTRVAVIAQHQRMPEIVRNNFSLESTPSVVAFDEERRYIGEEGLSKVTSRPAWAANLLRLHLLGKESNGILYKLDGDRLQTPRGEFDMVHLYSMLFNTVIGYARKMESAEAGLLPAKVVVAVPKCTSHAVELITGALRLCGMPKESILVTTDGVAAAACYRGLRFESLPKSLEEAQSLAIVDIGHGFHTVTVSSIAKEGVKILSEVSAPIGSSSIDCGLLAQLLEDVKKDHKQDFTTDSMLKQKSRISKEAMKAKEVMSTVGKHTMQLEALTDTFDLKYPMSVDTILTHSAPLRSSINESIDAALAEAGVKREGLREIQVIGGGWRTPALQDHLKELLSTESLNVHLDPVQTVAQGCALIGMWRAEPAEGEEREEEVNGVHYLQFDNRELPEGSKPHTAEELEAIRAKETAIQEEETVYHARLDARNELESYVLSLPNVAYDAGLSEEEIEELNVKVKGIDDWVLSEEGEAAGPDVLLARLAEVKQDVQENYKKIAEHIEKVRLEEEEKDRKRAEEMRLAKDTKEPKTDPQRLKAAQERREQGVVLFKQESYAEAVTRFVQALAHLKDIYDLDKDDNKKRRNDTALSCHLNIASAAIKLTKYQLAAKNATQALEFEPKSAKAYFRRGQAQRLMKDFKSAREDLTQANELSGGDAGIKKELDLLEKQEAEQLKKDKKMYAKMFA